MACRRASRPAIVCRSRSVAAVPMSVVRPIVAVPRSVVRAIVAGPISVVWALVAAYPLAAPPIRCPHAAPAGAGRIAPVGAVPRRVASVFIAVPIWAPIVVSTLVSTAGERIGTRSHGVAAPGKSRPTVVAASAHVRPAAYADMRRTAACARSTGGRGAQRRAGGDNRRRGQTNRYLADHDAHSIRSEHPSLSESNSTISVELQRAAQSQAVWASASERQRSEPRCARLQRFISTPARAAHRNARC